MSVSRGEFLKQLGKSIPGMVLNGTVATAAQKLLGKMAAVSGELAVPSPTTAGKTQPEAITDPRHEFISSGPASGNRIALTFDDGPTPGVTDRILDELKQRQVHATFFMIGERIAAAPDLARRVLAEGHEIANHTYTHPRPTALTDAQLDAEIQKTVDVMHDVLGYRANWFRPPYGALHKNQAPILARKNLGIILWNVDPADWSQPGEAKIIESVLTKTKPGAIIVCHDLHHQTADSVGKILDGFLTRYLQPVTLSTLLEAHASFLKIKESQSGPKSLT